jgi:hypothetical protein
MKILAPLLVLIAVSVHVQASAGARPFTDGSPLVSGVDGNYQATARAKNLLGVFRFTYANGAQTSNPRLPTGNSVASLLTDPYNDYVFFVSGVVYRGLVQANINVFRVAGVFDNGGANVPNSGQISVVVAPTATPTATPTASPTATPTATSSTSLQNSLTLNSFMSGFFNGSIDQSSPDASFQGTGSVVVVSPAIQIAGSTGLVDGSSFERKFKFRGVRNHTGTTSTTSTSTSTSTTSG